MTRLIDRIDQSDRAVSPVIGVILMVAITVILAAVIGAFVLEIGDQQETAPSTSFDSEQQTEYIEAGFNSANYTTVTISHAGGNVVDINQVDVKFKGNSSVWGITNEKWGGSNRNVIVPQPNLLRALGTNEPQEFSSGSSWNLNVYNGIADENLDACGYMTRIVTGQSWPAPRIESGFGCGSQSTNGAPLLTRDSAGQHPYDENVGSTVNVVWSAQSGGKTQTLFKYTLQ